MLNSPEMRDLVDTARRRRESEFMPVEHDDSFWNFVIVVRGQPVAKKAPRFSRRSGIVYSDPLTKKYEAHARISAQNAIGDGKPTTEPLYVMVEVELPVPQSWSKKKQQRALEGIIAPTKRPDVDNLAKSALDACNTIIWHDDCQIVGLFVVKRYSDTSRLTIRVRVVESMASQ